MKANVFSYFFLLTIVVLSLLGGLLMRSIEREGMFAYYSIFNLVPRLHEI